MDEQNVVTSDEADVLVSGIMDELRSYPDDEVATLARMKLLALLNQEAMGAN